MENALLIGFLLIAGGVALIVGELFIPSHGVLALAAGGVSIAGVVVLFMHDPMWGVIGLLVLGILAPVSLGFALRVWPDTPIGRRMLHGEGGEHADEERRAREQRERDERLALIGLEGRAVTDLHPVGIIELEGKRMDAIAETTLVDAGATVRVTNTDHNQIRVRPV